MFHASMIGIGLRMEIGIIGQCIRCNCVMGWDDHDDDDDDDEMFQTST